MKTKLLYILLVTFSFTNFAQQEINTNDNLLEIQAYPNPFKTKTIISFTSKDNIIVNFKVQDILGNIVYSKKVITKNGKNQILFYKNKLFKGIYLYTLKTENQTITKRLVIK